MTLDHVPARARTNPCPQPTTVRHPAPMGDEPDLWARYHRRLVATTSRRVGPRFAEDAVQVAWIQFLRHQPEREHAYGWLALTARREAIRLAQRADREPAGDGPVIDEAGVVVDLPLGERTEHPVSLADRLDGRAALELLAGLPERQRRVLARKVAGLSYAEIEAELGWSYTQVNRHLSRARRSLREAAAG